MRNTILHKFLKSIYAPLTRTPLTEKQSVKVQGCGYFYLHTFAMAFADSSFAQNIHPIFLQFKIISPTLSDFDGAIYS